MIRLTSPAARSVNVTADVDDTLTTSGVVLTDLRVNVLPAILAGHPGVVYTFEGQDSEMRDSMEGLQRGFTIAVILIYALLAIPLKSYTQPLVIISAIPFGIVGAIWGHIITLGGCPMAEHGVGRNPVKQTLLKEGRQEQDRPKQQNLAHDPQYEDVVAKLIAMAREWDGQS